MLASYLSGFWFIKGFYCADRIYTFRGLRERGEKEVFPPINMKGLFFPTEQMILDIDLNKGPQDSFGFNIVGGSDRCVEVNVYTYT